MSETPTPSNAPTIEAARRFAALIRAEVLEEAAMLCDQHASIEGIAQRCADAIRAAKEGS